MGQQDSRDKRGPKRQAKAERFNDVQFVNRDLTRDESAHVKASNFDLSDLDSHLVKLVEAGYRITVKWDERGSCFAVFVQQTREDGDNAGFILTGRGSSPVKAIKQVCYKHFVLFAGDWISYVANVQSEIDD